MHKTNPYESPAVLGENHDVAKFKAHLTLQLGLIAVLGAWFAIVVHLACLFLAVAVGLFDKIQPPLRDDLYWLNGLVLSGSFYVSIPLIILVLIAGTRRDWIWASFAIPLYAFAIIRVLENAQVITF